MLSTLKCNVRHTLYQPTDAEWRCPNCGADNTSFIIDSSATNIDCEFMHNDDEIFCSNCGYDTTGKKFAAMLQKKHNLTKCQYCNGTGLVKI